MKGVPASPSGHSAEPEPCFTVSARRASVPNAKLLKRIAKRLDELHAPDRGLVYSSGRLPPVRYDFYTGAPLLRDYEPSELRIYGDRADFLYELTVEFAPVVAAALRAYASAIEARSDATVQQGAAEGESATRGAGDAQ